MIEPFASNQMNTTVESKEAAPSYREGETQYLELPKRDLKSLEQASPPAVSYDDQTSYFKPPDLTRQSTIRSTRYPANIESASGDIPQLERITLKDEPPQSEPDNTAFTNGSRFSEHLPRTPSQKKQINGVTKFLNGQKNELHRTMSEVSRTNHLLGDNAPEPIIDRLPPGFFNQHNLNGNSRQSFREATIPEEGPVKARPDERASIAAHRQESLQAIYGTQGAPVQQSSAVSLNRGQSANAVNPSSQSLQSTIKFSTRPVSLRPATARPYTNSMRSRPVSSVSRRKSFLPSNPIWANSKPATSNWLPGSPWQAPPKRATSLRSPSRQSVYSSSRLDRAASTRSRRSFAAQSTLSRAYSLPAQRAQPAQAIQYHSLEAAVADAGHARQPSIRSTNTVTRANVRPASLRPRTASVRAPSTAGAAESVHQSPPIVRGETGYRPA